MQKYNFFYSKWFVNAFCKGQGSDESFNWVDRLHNNNKNKQSLCSQLLCALKRDDQQAIVSNVRESLSWAKTKPNTWTNENQMAMSSKEDKIIFLIKVAISGDLIGTRSNRLSWLIDRSNLAISSIIWSLKRHFLVECLNLFVSSWVAILKSKTFVVVVVVVVAVNSNWSHWSIANLTWHFVPRILFVFCFMKWNTNNNL